MFVCCRSTPDSGPYPSLSTCPPAARRHTFGLPRPPTLVFLVFPGGLLRGGFFLLLGSYPFGAPSLATKQPFDDFHAGDYRSGLEFPKLIALLWRSRVLTVLGGRISPPPFRSRAFFFSLFFLLKFFLPTVGEAVPTVGFFVHALSTTGFLLVFYDFSYQPV